MMPFERFEFRFLAAALVALSVIAATANAITLTPASNSLVKPKSSVSVTLAITSTEDSGVGSDTLPSWVFQGDAAYWVSANLLLKSRTSSGSGSKKVYTNTYGAALAASDALGLHNLTWTPSYSKTPTKSFGPVQLMLEISCSDGNPCNGMERWVQGQCVRAAHDLCDDFEDCTRDECSPEGFCSHSVNPAAKNPKKCVACASKNCVPHCQGAQCGDDGCGGSCGTCAPSLTCVEGSCQQISIPGTCNTPIDLSGDFNAVGWRAQLQYTGDTAQGIHLVAPACNAQSGAAEIVYRFTLPDSLPSSVGIDARMSGINGDPNSLDTVMEIIEVPNKLSAPADVAAACLNSQTSAGAATVVGCADDSSPPGGLSSRVTWMMKVGYTYLLVADGYSSAQVGPYQLNVTLTPGCTMACAGKFCGSSGCLFSCGACPAGMTCGSAGRCVPVNCVPSCAQGRLCGDNGCGGSCGTCAAGFECISSTGKCRHKEACNHLIPRCINGVEGSEGCPAQQFCGSDCRCHDLKQPLMDLTIDKASILPSVGFEVRTFDTSSCAMAEGCVLGPGPRRLMKFATNVANQGSAAFAPPGPPASFPELYEYASCHGHWHFSGFAAFSLLDAAGKLVMVGRKQSYCAEDSYRLMNSPSVPCDPSTSCDAQGLSPGWVDVYGPDLDCQWLDITDVAPGQYQLRMCTNMLRSFEEENRENNCATVPVTIPAAAASQTGLSSASVASAGVVAAGVTALLLMAVLVARRRYRRRAAEAGAPSVEMLSTATAAATPIHAGNVPSADHSDRDCDTLRAASEMYAQVAEPEDHGHHI